jgi:hypothetical protein
MKKKSLLLHHMKKYRVISSHFESSFKHGLVVVAVVAFLLIVQELVGCCEQLQQMNIQEDLVEVELEKDVLIVFLAQDNHKHVLELVPMMKQMINVQDTNQDRWVDHKQLMEY